MTGQAVFSHGSTRVFSNLKYLRLSSQFSKIEVSLQNFVSHDLSLKTLTEINENLPK